MHFIMAFDMQNLLFKNRKIHRFQTNRYCLYCKFEDFTQQKIPYLAKYRNVGTDMSFEHQQPVF